MLFVALAFTLKAQLYDNEWIDFSKKYYKFKIGKTGFYRIDSAALANSGINVPSLNPKNLQLFIRGQEVPIYIRGEADNKFNDSDYVEFFAEKNDGRFDSTLYHNITYLPNPYLSLFSDTLHAFLTWNNLTNNKRIIVETDTSSASYTPAPYFYTEKIFTVRDEYNPVAEYYNSTSDPRYTEGEGWGKGLFNGGTYNTNISPINMYSLSPLPVYVNINFSGSSVDGTVPYDHEIKGVIYDGTNTPVKLFDTLFNGYKYFKYNFTFPSNSLGNGSNIEMTSINNPIFTGVNNRTSVHFIYYKYPQLPDLANNTFYKLMVDDDAVQAKTYLKLTGVSTGPGTKLIIHNVTNSKRF